MSCKNCERLKNIPLVCGKIVCSYCEEWRNECEARELLRLPLLKRRQALAARSGRGEHRVNKLKETMRDVWREKKGYTQ